MQIDKPASPNRRIARALTLVLLSPIVAEVLSGATRLSSILALIPEIMVWGCGALIIRETVRRRSLGWTSLLLMGLALSVAEEFVIQQTSLAPLPWLAISLRRPRFVAVIVHVEQCDLLLLPCREAVESYGPDGMRAMRGNDFRTSSLGTLAFTAGFGAIRRYAEGAGTAKADDIPCGFPINPSAGVRWIVHETE